METKSMVFLCHTVRGKEAVAYLGDERHFDFMVHAYVFGIVG